MLLKPSSSLDEDYLMGELTAAGKTRSTAPQVIRGDLEIQRLVRKVCPFDQKETQIVMSFHIDDRVKDYDLNVLCGLVERVVYPGFEDQYYFPTWVKHEQVTDGRPRVDVHGVFTNMDLRTGKQFSPYYHKADCDRIDLLKQIINIVYGFAEPNSPEHSCDIGVTREGVRGKTAQFILALIRKEKLETREEIAIHLGKCGYKLSLTNGSFRSKKSMSMRTPDGHFIKLKGDPIAAAYGRAQPAQWIRSDDYTSDVNKMIEKLNRMCERRAERNWNRYRAKAEGKSYSAAQKDGDGFHPITIGEIKGEKYEPEPNRNRSADSPNFERYPSGKSGHPNKAGSSGETAKAPADGGGDQDFKTTNAHLDRIIGKIRRKRIRRAKITMEKNLRERNDAPDFNG